LTYTGIEVPVAPSESVAPTGTVSPSGKRPERDVVRYDSAAELLMAAQAGSLGVIAVICVCLLGIGWYAIRRAMARPRSVSYVIVEWASGVDEAHGIKYLRIRIRLWLWAGRHWFAELVGRHWLGARRTNPEKSVASAEPPIGVDPIEIQVGRQLIVLASDESVGSGGLLNRLKLLRAGFAEELGIVLPIIRIRDNLQLKANEYRILLRGNEVARSEIFPDRLLAMNPGGAHSLEGIDGDDAVEPAFGLPARWIHLSEQERAAGLGYTVVVPLAVLVTHFGEIIRRYSMELLDLDDTDRWIARLAVDSPVLAREIRRTHDLTTVQATLQLLLAEGVSIRDGVSIGEVLVAHPGDRALHLADLAHLALARQITKQHSRSGVLSALVLSARAEGSLAGRLSNEQPSGIELSDGELELLRSEFARAFGQADAASVLLVSSPLRRSLSGVTRHLSPSRATLTWGQTYGNAEVRPFETIDFELEPRPSNGPDGSSDQRRRIAADIAATGTALLTYDSGRLFRISELLTRLHSELDESLTVASNLERDLIQVLVRRHLDAIEKTLSRTRISSLAEFDEAGANIAEVTIELTRAEPGLMKDVRTAVVASTVSALVVELEGLLHDAWPALLGAAQHVLK